MHPKLLGGSIFIDSVEVTKFDSCDLSYEEQKNDDKIINFSKLFENRTVEFEVENQVLNIDLLNGITNKCNIICEHLVPVRRHRKKRIAKKWLKRYGQRTIQEVLENMKIVDCGDNTIEFIKEY